MSESVSKSESGSGSGSWSERVQWPSLTSRCPVAMPALSMCAGYVYVVALFPARACTHTHTHTHTHRARACSVPVSTEPPTVAEPGDEFVAESPPLEPADACGVPCADGLPFADGVPFWGYETTPEWARTVIQATPDGLHGNDDTEAVWSGSARLC